MRPFTVVIAFLPVLAGCATVNTMAVKGVASTLSEGGDTVTSHDDPELIAGAMPFALMLHESLLASVPTHEPLLTTTCSLYTQYAFGFVAADAEALQRDDYERSKAAERPRVQARRARAGTTAGAGLEVKFRGIGQTLKTDPARALARAKKEHVRACSTGRPPRSGPPSRPAASTIPSS